MDETLERRSPALGIASLATAFAGIAILVYYALNSGISIQGNTVYVVGPYPFGSSDNVTFGYIGISLCVLGVVFGVEGFRRPASQKLIAIVGMLFNASILLAAACVIGMYWYWFR